MRSIKVELSVGLHVPLMYVINAFLNGLQKDIKDRVMENERCTTVAEYLAVAAQVERSHTEKKDKSTVNTIEALVAQVEALKLGGSHTPPVERHLMVMTGPI